MVNKIESIDNYDDNIFLNDSIDNSSTHIFLANDETPWLIMWIDSESNTWVVIELGEFLPY